MPKYIVRSKSREVYWKLKKGVWSKTENRDEAERFQVKDWADRFAKNQIDHWTVEKVED